MNNIICQIEVDTIYLVKMNVILRGPGEILRPKYVMVGIFHFSCSHHSYEYRGKNFMVDVCWR